MDVQMPEMDGFEATRVIRQKEKQTDGHIPIIAMTAHAMRGDRENCIEAGMDHYVSKPLNEKRLLKVIENSVQIKVGAKTKTIKPLHNGDIAVDREEALARLGNDERLLKKIWKAFIADAPRQMEVLRKALKADDPALVEHQAHSLKGAAANIGAGLMKDKASQMEVASRERELNQAHTLYPQLEYEFKKALMALSEATTEASKKSF
jgi:CheY-like chemotaxis protein